ncbi:hypothetical protein PINS_up011553 [Pythium insidiosum]|nr:hypothetical protein PINS_up011553 [Pythium insidiosum]
MTSLPQVFSQQSLATPTFRQRLSRVHALSAVLCLRLLHVCSLQDACATDVATQWDAVSAWTRSYLLAGAWRSNNEDAPDAFTGIVLLAWATLLARVYRSPPSSLDRSQCESDLRDVLAAAESLSAFQQLRRLLRCLVFDQAIDENEDGAAELSTAAAAVAAGAVPPKTSWSLVGWELPSVDDITGRLGIQLQERRCRVCRRVPARRRVVLDDALSVLGYVDALTSVDAASAMVKLLVPVLQNAAVARLVLDGTRSVTSALDAAPSSVGGAISDIVDASTHLWPQHALPGLRLHTALSLALPRDGTDATLQALSLPRRLHEHEDEEDEDDDGMRDTHDDGRTWRAMPPDHYVDVRDDDVVVCRQSFVYEDDGFVVRTGAEGTLRVVVVAQETIEQVHWRHDTTRATPPTLSVLDVLVDDVEQQHVESLTALFEWIASSSSAALANALREWALARLRSWWRAQQLSGSATELPMRLAREHDVSLSRLLAASREDLVEWGVSDRHLRECLLSRAGSTAKTAFTTTHRRSHHHHHHHHHHQRQKDALVRDAAGHLLRLAVDVLEHYASHSVESEDGETDETMLMASALAALRLLPRVLALDAAVETLVTELSVERVHRVVVHATRKLFELHESAVGTYDGVAATTETMLRVARWFVARDARRLTSAAAAGASCSLMQDDHDDDESVEREQQRQWLVATVEFVLDVLATHETWRFERLQDKWALVDRCLRVLTALLTARGFRDAASFQRALRDAVVSDAALLMKVLRSCARLLTSSNDTASAAAAGRLYPFEWVLKSESSLPGSRDARRDGAATRGYAVPDVQ